MAGVARKVPPRESAVAGLSGDEEHSGVVTVNSTIGVNISFLNAGLPTATEGIYISTVGAAIGVEISEKRRFSTCPANIK